MPMGCGVACVAYLLGETYPSAKERHFDGVVRGDDGQRGYTRAALRLALEHGGFTVVERRFREEWRLTRPERIATILQVTTAPSRALVLFERYPDDKYRHYVVLDRGIWIDPLDTPARKQNLRGQRRASLPSKWKALGYLLCRR